MWKNGVCCQEKQTVAYTAERGKMKNNRITKTFMLLTAATTVLCGNGIQIQAAEPNNTWVSDKDVSASSTAAPKADSVVPNDNQYNYQKEELSAFVHFGPNTFNGIEWGENYGNKTPDQIFTLEQDFDEETLVKALHDAGFKKVIVTAKHHDGFCIWDSAHTDYDVAATSYRNAEGQSDILAEISAACSKYDLDMGLYLSPWDIHDKSYGYYDQNGNPTTAENDHLDYNDYYNSQLEEILGNNKYGNKGHFVEVWMDGAKGSGANAQDYDFKRWFDTIQSYEGKAAGFEADCMLFGAQAYTTVRWIGNESGYSAKDTWSKSSVDYDKNTINSNSKSDGGYSVTAGFENGNQWTVPEADARITSGWFWGNAKKTPKSISELGNMYFNTVGRNSVLLLNVPPNDQGTVDKAILDRVEEFGNNIRDTFQTNLAAASGAQVKASSVRGNDTAYKPGNTVDGNDTTYWTTNDGTNTGSLLIDLGGTKNIDVVSVEEAIQCGQRINHYTVEYRNGDSDTWKTMDEGTTIGAKRLVRTSAVRASQIRITVSTPAGKVPVISEIGVYKASDGFQLTGGIPADLEIIDNTDKNPADGSYFDYNSGWKQETGTQFIEGTGMWANPKAQFTVHFKGTKAYLMGTVDPGHGTADIYVDGKFVKTIDTKSSERKLGQILFETETLKNGNHTLRLVTKTKAIGVDALAVINNGGAGVFEIEKAGYTMEEASDIEITVKRVGGNSGKATVLVSNEPGSAVQGDMNPDQQTVLTFEDGETEKTATVTTLRNTAESGDKYFTVTLTDPTGGAGLGFNSSSRVTISDAEAGIIREFNELISESDAKKADWYKDGWSEFSQALETAKAIVISSDVKMTEIKAAKADLEAAIENLQARDKYTEKDPFVFPWKEGSSAILEAEFATKLINTSSGDNGYSLNVANGSWASNGKFINALNRGDKVKYYYTAERAGTYNVTLYYRSGSNSNSIAWGSEEGGKITAGTIKAGAANVSQVQNVSFKVEIAEPGSGYWVFTGPAGNSPQIDYMVITPAEIVPNLYTITANAGEGGIISDAGETVLTEGDSKTYRITPSSGFEIADVLVNNESVGPVSEYTVSQISGDVTIEARFALANYTEDNRFVFPSNEETVTLEAEHFLLNNIEESGERWALQVVNSNWASGGKFVNAFNKDDTISLPYTAESGIYEVTATYRSGSNSNSLVWGGDPLNKITAGSVKAGAADNAKNTHTVTFRLEIAQKGDGTLVFTGPASKSPQLDKFEIRLVEKIPSKYVVMANAGPVGTISSAGKTTLTEGESRTYTITPDSGYAVLDVTVNGESVGAVSTYTVSDICEDVEIKATFEFSHYTTENPFLFPKGAESVTLEAEHFTLHNTGGDDEPYKLGIAIGDWASNGKFVNALNAGDQIRVPYVADEGTYEVTITYKSGSLDNKVEWSEESGNIVANRSSAAATDYGLSAHTGTFNLVVKKGGAGVLIFTGPSGNSPQIDKFELRKID